MKIEWIKNILNEPNTNGSITDPYGPREVLKVTDLW